VNNISNISRIDGRSKHHSSQLYLTLTCTHIHTHTHTHSLCHTLTHAHIHKTHFHTTERERDTFRRRYHTHTGTRLIINASWNELNMCEYGSLSSIFWSTSCSLFISFIINYAYLLLMQKQF